MRVAGSIIEDGGLKEAPEAGLMKCAMPGRPGIGRSVWCRIEGSGPA